MAAKITKGQIWGAPIAQILFKGLIACQISYFYHQKHNLAKNCHKSAVLTWQIFLFARYSSAQTLCYITLVLSAASPSRFLLWGGVGSGESLIGVKNCYWDRYGTHTETPKVESQIPRCILIFGVLLDLLLAVDWGPPPSLPHFWW